VHLDLLDLMDRRVSRASRDPMEERERGVHPDCLDLQELLETEDHLEISPRSLDHQALRDRKEILVCLESMVLMENVGKEARQENRVKEV